MTLEYLGILIAVFIPVIGFGWRLLSVLNKVENTISSVAKIIEKVEANMTENEITHEQIVAKMDVFKAGIDAELKSINVRLDHIDDRLGKT